MNAPQDESGGEFTFTVGDEDDGDRLDIVLARAIPTLSRSRLKQPILDGQVNVNGRTLFQPKHRVKHGDVVVLDMPPPLDAEPEPQNIPLTVLYEDQDLIVIDKPAGLVVHPAPGSPDGTLVNALLHHCGQELTGIGGVKRPGIVHRLDKDTTGVMVAAKTELAQTGLAAQFADHGRTGPLQRAYTAFVWGQPSPRTGMIDAPLGRDRHNRLKQAVTSSGRHARTHYQTVQRFGDEGWDLAKLECRLETGRTHQIRVHMSHIGHPIVADPVYASGYATKANRLPEELRKIVGGLGRQALHARQLGFEHPRTGESLIFEAPLPPDLAAFDAALGSFSIP